MTEIMENLFVGNWMEAKSCSDEFYVVTVAHDSPFVGKEHFKLVDGPGNDPDMIVRAARSVCIAHRDGKKVMVHCHGGRSRSGAIAVLSVMMITGENLCRCYDLVKDKHEITRIHPYLSEILLSYDREKERI